MTRRDLIPHFSWGPWGGDIGLDIEALGDAAAKGVMLRRFIPHFEVLGLGGGIDDETDVEGWSLLIVWLGLCVEICIGRVTRPQR
jgi:hypothetical protein